MVSEALVLDVADPGLNPTCGPLPYIPPLLLYSLSCQPTVRKTQKNTITNSEQSNSQDKKYNSLQFEKGHILKDFLCFS